MKRTITLALALLLSAGLAYSQQPTQPQGGHHHPHGEGHHPHGGPHGPQAPQTPPATQYNADGIQMDIVEAFPTVKSIKKTDKWTEVYNAQHQIIGYAIYSKPASDGIKGYAGETPVMIALDTKKKITGVYLLPNVETPRFAQRVADAGFYSSWNGLSIKQARKKTVDAVSGATYTSRAVAQSVQAALERF